jgi:molybdate transport system substrate-binding protein
LLQRWVFGSAVVAACTLGACRPAPPSRPTVRVAAASDLQPVFSALSADFEALHPPWRVEASFGASGTLFAQLRQQAPFDVFLSADAKLPETLASEGFADGPVVEYAQGHLALCSQSAQGGEAPSLESVAGWTQGRIAIAHPQHAPYGRAAMEAFERSGLKARLEPKLVIAENVAQAAQFLRSGAAQAAVISGTLAKGTALAASIRCTPVSPGLHSGLRQAGVVMKATRHQDLAHAFLEHLVSARGQKILDEHGLSAVP